MTRSTQATALSLAILVAFAVSCRAVDCGGGSPPQTVESVQSARGTPTGSPTDSPSNKSLASSAIATERKDPDAPYDDPRQAHRRELVEFIARFQQAVRLDRRSEVAKFLGYPFMAQKPQFGIANEDEFVSHYETIVDPCVKAAIFRMSADGIKWTREGLESKDSVLTVYFNQPDGPWEVESIGNDWCNQSRSTTTPR